MQIKHDMSKVTIPYRDLSFEAMVKISELADILRTPPNRAREIYLTEAAKRDLRTPNQKEAA